MTRKVMNWVDKKMDELKHETNPNRVLFKAMGLGLIEGSVDGLLFAGSLCTGAIVVKTINNVVRHKD